MIGRRKLTIGKDKVVSQSDAVRLHKVSGAIVEASNVVVHEVGHPRPRHDVATLSRVPGRRWKMKNGLSEEDEGERKSKGPVGFNEHRRRTAGRFK